MPTRRRVLQAGSIGVVAVGAIGVTGGRAAAPAGAAGLLGQLFCALPAVAAAGTTETLAASPVFEPFGRLLPMPTLAQPVSRAGGIDRYELEARPAVAAPLPGLQTEIWGYDGLFPGPMIIAERGRPVVLELRNVLAAPTALHLHGARTGPDDDGHPDHVIAPGASREYHYPNEQLGATLWYHDHVMHQTGEHVYRGLAGLYLLHDPAEDALGLPAGARDVPLVLADRAFDEDGGLVYDGGRHGGFFGDVTLVNGVAAPYLQVEAAAYRLRLLNASNARSYELALPDGPALVQIASDGGLLPEPVPRPTVTLAPAERVEVVVDFFGIAPGTSLTLRSILGKVDLLRFDVVGSAAPAAATLPQRLAAAPALAAPRVTRHVRLTFDAAANEFTFNGLPWDSARIDYTPRLGTVERWRITNTAVLSHPVHLHLVQFTVVSRRAPGGVALPPPPWERGWKDTVMVGVGETVEVDAAFEGFAGRYVYHCHILEHEDHAMMAQFRVVDLQRLAGEGRVETAAAISTAAFRPGIASAYVATADGFADALAGGPAAATVAAPILLTSGAALHPATAAELRRLQPDAIVVLGGERAVPQPVLEELRSLAATGAVQRLAGDSRYATAAAISRAHFSPGVEAAYVATGTGFADALAGGPAAALRGAPMLLVEPGAVPADTAAELQRLHPGEVVILGGTGVVSYDVERALGRFAPVRRLAGAGRYDTCAAIVVDAFPGPSPTVFVATGTGFADALAGVPAGAVAQGGVAPLLLMDRTGIPAPIATQLRRLSPSRIVVLGGSAAVPTAVEDALEPYLA